MSKNSIFLMLCLGSRLLPVISVKPNENHFFKVEGLLIFVFWW